ncbi:MAG: DoxX family protein [Myxococcales bacterium FL481]|nr:MAG: DoxX family protein [Myxococcales bacterium FL481]
MRKTKIAYIVVTALFSAFMVFSGVMDIVQPEMVLEEVGKLGLPFYLLTLIGIWKLLGAVALARPKLRRINEWAYAGFAFDLTGAAYLHGASGDWAGVAPPLVFLGVLVASYVLREKSLGARA